MNLIKMLSLLAISSTLSFSQTTMCFKQNHKDFTTLENTLLDGGLCAGKNSLNDMKKDGWETSDIKIDGNNYIYILKKDETSISTINMEKLEAQILKRLELKEEEKSKAELAEKKRLFNLSGKTMYIAKCQSCHGEKGETIYSTSRALNTLNFFDFKTTIRDYKLNTYDRGNAIAMSPYAKMMFTNDIKAVYAYLKSINPEIKEESKK